MTNTEIDRKLALAMGYLPEHVAETHGAGRICIDVKRGKRWHVFSHQDPTVILPIIERYDCAPYFVRKEWHAYLGDHPTATNCRHTNPRTAIALAVIKAKDMGLI